MSTVQTAPPAIDDTYEFGVSPGLISIGGGLDGSGDGTTVTGISTDGVNFTPTDSGDPTSQSSVNGQYVSFSADANGDDTISAIPDDQTVIDAIEANSGASTPLSDTFYYQLTNAVGTTVEQVTYDLNDVEFNTSGSPYASPSTVAPDTSTNISGLTVDTALATGQSTDAGEVLSVTVSLFDFATQQSDGTISIDPSQTGSGAGTGETITTDNTDQTHSVTIDGTIAQIDADLQGLTYTSAASGDDSILVQAVDGPATTADFIIGEVQTSAGASPPPQMLPVDNTFNDSFNVYPGLYATSGDLDGINSGDTITGVSTDDINFTPVTSTDPTYQNSTEVDGQYLFLKANSDGTGQQGPLDNQAAIDAIQADSTGTTPITDTFYYEVFDGTTTQIDQVNYQLNDVEINTIQAAPYNAPENVAANTSVNIAGITIDTALATGQTSDANEVLTVTVGVFDFNTQASDGYLSIDPNAVGSGGETGETITTDTTDPTHTVTIEGTVAQINADLQGLTYTSDIAGNDVITVQVVDGPATTADFIVGDLQAACYCPGTMILTETGEVAVEDLRIGDRIVTLLGGTQPIKWIGRRSYDGRFVNGQVLMLPVCIKQGAIDVNVPARDLWVSAGHAIYIDGVLVPAWLLANGKSIVQSEAVDSVTYIHVELGEHDVIVADGCPAESFIDDHCRNQFQNAAEFRQLYPGEEEVTGSLCAERIESGFRLLALQNRLRDRAGLAPIAIANGLLRGFVDQAGPALVSGWAQDVSQPEAPVCLDVLVDGRRIHRILANRFRADLRHAGIGSGKHSFMLRLPPGMTGQIEVRCSADRGLLSLTRAARAKAA